MVLKQIKTHNIQTHRDITIDLPPTGLIRFSGENSNGKSVIRKVWNDIIRNDLTKPMVRNRDIKFGEQYGEVLFVRDDGAELYYRIHHEAAQTYAELRMDGKVLRRYLADKNINELVEAFGMHYSDVADRSLNVMDSDEALLFFKTPYKANGDLLQTALRDHKAERALEELQRVTKETKRVKTEFEKQIAISEAAKAAMTIYDVEAETDKKAKCLEYARILELLEPMRMLPDLEKPKTGFIDMPTLVLYKLARPRYIDLSFSLDDAELIRLGEEVHEFKQGRCPVCKRRFFV